MNRKVKYATQPPAEAVAVRPAARIPTWRELGAWLVAHRTGILVIAVVTIALLAHGINMFQYPYYEADEGTYMSQAWSVINEGRVAPYTYWYDHAPVGWLQIAVWSLVTGGFFSFGTAVESGRVFMLLLQLGSTALVFGITYSVSRRMLAATLAAIVFALSAYGIYYHRRVLLDNIAAFWMLVSIWLLVREKTGLTRVWASALALGISILSKELTIFVVPALAYLAYSRTHPSLRRLATTGWLAIVGSVFSLYFLFAALRGELFPSGTFLGGSNEHVSLFSTLLYQMGRGTDSGILSASSGFWEMALRWAREEPLLVIGGTACAFLSLLAFRRKRTVAILGLTSLLLWLFLCRGGIVIAFYLVPLLPVLAINIGLMLGLLADSTRGVPALGRSVPVAAAGVCLAAVLPGYTSPSLGFQSNPLTLWNNQQAQAQKDAISWIRRNLPPGSSMVIDNYMWTDLRDGPGNQKNYNVSHTDWKAELDPEIRTGVFQDDWRNVDYVIATPQTHTDVDVGQMSLVEDAMQHSTPIVHFDTGGWPVTVLRVWNYQQLSVTDDRMLQRTWTSYKTQYIQDGRVIDPSADGQTTSEGQSYALLQAVLSNDQKTFDHVWAWTQANLQRRDDGLLAWRWGRQDNGTDGVLDSHTATDADQDAALALLFAARRWNAPAYQQQAITILNAIWAKETAEAGGQRIVIAGDWALDRGDSPVVNPSYLAPYAYRVFAEADPQHDWKALVDSSYSLLERVSTTPALGGSAGLVPNWMIVESNTGALGSAVSVMGDEASDFSYDASRVPWRLAVDLAWSNDPRARQALEAIRFPREMLSKQGKLFADYWIDGTPVATNESLSMYAGVLPVLLVDPNPDLVHQVFADKVLSSYHESPNSAHWGEPGKYYDENWAWFTTALLHGGFTNLWDAQPPIDWKAILRADSTPR